VQLSTPFAAIAACRATSGTSLAACSPPRQLWHRQQCWSSVFSPEKPGKPVELQAVLVVFFYAVVSTRLGSTAGSTKRHCWMVMETLLASERQSSQLPASVAEHLLYLQGQCFVDTVPPAAHVLQCGLREIPVEFRTPQCGTVSEYSRECNRCVCVVVPSALSSVALYMSATSAALTWLNFLGECHLGHQGG
jgi:hypothetical protein